MNISKINEEINIIDNIKLVPFISEYQNAARNLILSGFFDRWGSINETLNQDLNNIEESYIKKGDDVITIWVFEVLIGIGMLIYDQNLMPLPITQNQNNIYGRIVRMSVKKSMQRKGIGKIIVNYLKERAIVKGMTHVLIETNNDWEDAIALYTRCGFEQYYEDTESKYLVLSLK